MNIKEKYIKEVIPKMKSNFNLKNDLEVPQIKKVIVNVGIGKFIKESSQVEDIVETLSQITGQKPMMTKAKKSIAGFKIREGTNVGVKVTLRGSRMWNFIQRLAQVSLPRVRDFHGLKITAVDKSGNLNIGLKEQFIFPEILPEKVKTVFGLEITIVTDARSREKGMELFKLLGFPMEGKE